jgi:hypothetical protein
MLRGPRLARYRFSPICTSEVQVRPFPGAVGRGALGHALHAVDRRAIGHPRAVVERMLALEPPASGNAKQDLDLDGFGLGAGRDGTVHNARAPRQRRHAGAVRLQMEK